MSNHANNERLTIVSAILAGSIAGIVYVPRNELGAFLISTLTLVIILCVYFLIASISELRYRSRGTLGHMVLRKKWKEHAFDGITDIVYIASFVSLFYLITQIIRQIFEKNNGSLVIPAIIGLIMSGFLSYRFHTRK